MNLRKYLDKLLGRGKQDESAPTDLEEQVDVQEESEDAAEQAEDAADEEDADESDEEEA